MMSLFVCSQEGLKPPASQSVNTHTESKTVFARYLLSRWVTAWGLVLVLLLSACASKPVVIPGGIDHPADPIAVQAPLVPRSAALTSDPVKAPPPASMGGDHSMHRMKH